MTEEEKRSQWYVVQVLSGQEQKVHDNLLKRIKTEEMGDYVYDVVLPTERVSEIKRGKKTETTRKFFPGYIIVNMWLFDEAKQLVGKTWYFIRDTPGVIGFAGTKDRPIAMHQHEVGGAPWWILNTGRLSALESLFNRSLIFNFSNSKPVNRWLKKS